MTAPEFTFVVSTSDYTQAELAAMAEECGPPSDADLVEVTPPVPDWLCTRTDALPDLEFPARVPADPALEER